MTDRTLAEMSPGSIGDLEAWVEVYPAHYCMSAGVACRTCDEGRRGDHGRGSAQIVWYLRGHDLAVQLKAGTNWSHSKDPLKARPDGLRGWDLGHHSLRPTYEGEMAMGSCFLFGGQTCYYDGSSLAADEGVRLLIDEGTGAMWAWLHEYFVQVLNDRSTLDRRMTA